jgi:Protein of unknown function (DUF1822)
MSFLSEPLTELHLDLPPDLHQQCWQRGQSALYPPEQWNRYLNQVSLATFLPWLQAEHAPSAIAETGFHPAQQDWVTGTAIALGNKRLVLIPSFSLDASELRVPQEWIDSPDHAGDYFLAVQLNLDDLQLYIWGYATHAQLKSDGYYDQHDRVYTLDAHSVIRDVSVLWIVRQLNADEPTQAAIAPIPVLSADQSANLLTQSAQSALHARLSAPFEQWAALLTNSNLCQRLVELRLSAQPSGARSASAEAISTRLEDWLQNQFAAGWQTVESFFGNDSDLAYSLRKTAELSETAIRRVKRIHLGDYDILLVMEIELEADGRLVVRVQLRPFDRAQLLPPDLALRMLSPTGEILQAVQSRAQDNLIQLKRFRCVLQTEFVLQIAIDDVAIVESFIV